MRHNTINGALRFVPFSKVYMPLLTTFFLFLISCKHPPPVDPTGNPQFVPGNTCGTQLVGVRDSLNSGTVDQNPFLNVNFINRANGFWLSTFGQGGGILDNYDHQGLVIDGVYYFLIRSDSSSPGTFLQCINLSTELTQSIYIPNLYLSYLLYDSSSQTFFAKSHYNISSDSLALFQLSINAIINYQNIIAIPDNLISSTIDPDTHKIYLLSNNGSNQLSVYYNAALQNIPVSDNSAAILGLRFNINDHFLYALQDTNVIKINPSTGLITKLCGEPYQLSTSIFGAVIDQCNNQYIISGQENSSPNTGVFIIYDNSVGKLASIATPWYCYTALSVNNSH